MHRIIHFKVDLVVGGDLFLNIQMERVGVVTFVGNTFDNAEVFLIQTAETVAQTFAWCGVQTEAIAGFCLPAFYTTLRRYSTMATPFWRSCFVVVNMTFAVQSIDGFVNADVTQGDGSTTILENLTDLVIVRLQSYTTGTFNIRIGCHTGADIIQALEYGSSGHLSPSRRSIQQFVRNLLR